LGLGVVASVDAAAKRLGVEFAATGEKRLYALGTAVLRRVQFRAGETIATRDGGSLVVEAVEEQDGLLTYRGQGRSVREDAIADATSVNLPHERLLAGQADPGEVFDLRYRTLQAQAHFRQSEVRGFLGGRIDLIPHQFYILREVAARQIPRVLLADEVGLGKTIEACLIVQRLLAVGKARRVLVLVPESLTHQWFVELLRRFNLWFSIYDEERCLASEQSDPGQNPFLATQLALCSVGMLAGSAARREQAVAAGWDVVVVDEAHHLVWAPERASPEYALVEDLARRSPGLLLLTATPTQLGLEGHFARLRLLDPNRYEDFDRFRKEAEGFGAVADVAAKIVERQRLTAKDHAALKRIFTRDRERLARHLAELEQGKPGAHAALVRTLLDQHGTGRVVFRNMRAAMSGFPARRFCPHPLKERNLTVLARIAREVRAEETGEAAGMRYAFREDPRLDWLVGFLKQDRARKALLICHSQAKAVALAAALQERMSARVGLFHEGLPLVQRDRNAAWFAEPDGAQLLLCSEIGSEGRNFQFAHHLILFDLPLNPGLIEQRIGRLDRIGQTETIRIHVPYVAGSAEEVVVEWYHRGLAAFATPLHGGTEYEQVFKARVIALATNYAEGGKVGRPQLEALLAETVAFREKLDRQLRQGRDRLLELNSFNREVAEEIIARVRAADADPRLRNLLLELLDHFGVRIREHEEGDVLLDPSHAYIESFPSIPAEGMLATFSRARALVREDIKFLSPDHALAQDAIDLLLESKAGTTAFGTLEAGAPQLLLEAVFVLEAVADTRWHVEQFLAPTPVRVVVDLGGRETTEEYPAVAVAAGWEDGDLHRFLEQPGFNAEMLREMVDAAAGGAKERAQALQAEATAKAEAALTADLERLLDLQKLNDHVRPEEIDLARERLGHTRQAIAHARLRLDAIRLIAAGGEE
jgi:ATP-dependent helicase HepA